MRNTSVKNITIIFLLMRLTSLITAQESSGPRVIVQSSPDIPVAGLPWSLSLLVNHPLPEEVTVMAPPFTGLLLLDQVLKVPRIVNPATGQVFTVRNAAEEQDMTASGSYERWTVMEYRFMLLNSGTADLDSFVITTPWGSTETSPLAVRVQRAQERGEILRPRVAWERLPASLRVGESAVLSLRVTNWLSQMPLPGPETFMSEVPPGVILESVSISPDERAAGLALKLRLIPLSAETFNLPRRTVSQGNGVFDIPALRIPVHPALSAARDSPAVTGLDTAEDSAAVQFPALEPAAGAYPSLFRKFSSDCENIYAGVKSLWEEGSRVNALAELRRRERDHSAGALFAFLRDEAERSLGLERTKSEETKRPLPWRRQSASGIMKESSVHRVPDPAGGEIAIFREGQPVRLMSGERRTGRGWVRVTSYDDNGVSGWVPEDNIIFY